MNNTLVMDICGAWFRKPKASSADQMNAWADEKERQFVAKYLGSLIDPLETVATATTAGNSTADRLHDRLDDEI